MIKVYTTAYCPYCRAAKSLLKNKGIPFEEIEIKDPETKYELMTKLKWETVPIIVMGDKIIGGYRELVELDRSGRLKELLNGCF